VKNLVVWLIKRLLTGSSASPNGPDDRFSKSPLVVGTAHLAFASGLRSYDSPHSSNTSRVSSPGTEICDVIAGLASCCRASHSCIALYVFVRCLLTHCKNCM